MTLPEFIRRKPEPEPEPEPGFLPPIGDNYEFIPVEDSDETQWWEGKLTCHICGHVQHSVVEIPKGADCPIVPCECSNCGHMAAWFVIEG